MKKHNFSRNYEKKKEFQKIEDGEGQGKKKKKTKKRETKSGLR